MKITKHTIKIKVYYDESRKGSKYSIDNISFTNYGGICEMLDKVVKGFPVQKYDSLRYDEASDIQETLTSVKSSKATLTSVFLGNSYDEIKENYFKNVHSTNWDFVKYSDNTLTIYNMDKKEFESFLDNFHYYDKVRKVVRIKYHSSKMERWLHEQASK